MREVEFIETREGKVVAAAWHSVECHQAQEVARVKHRNALIVAGKHRVFEDAVERAPDNHGAQEQDDGGSLVGDSEQVSQGALGFGREELTDVESELLVRGQCRVEEVKCGENEAVEVRSHFGSRSTRFKPGAAFCFSVVARMFAPSVAPHGHDDRDAFVHFARLFSGIPTWMWRLRYITLQDSVPYDRCDPDHEVRT